MSCLQIDDGLCRGFEDVIIIVLHAFCFLKECYVKIRQAVYILFSKLPLLLINGGSALTQREKPGH